MQVAKRYRYRSYSIDVDYIDIDDVDNVYMYTYIYIWIPMLPPPIQPAAQIRANKGYPVVGSFSHLC